MNKAKLAKQEAKQEGYVLTEKGLQAAAGPGKWPNSMDDVILRVMLKSPDAPLTKGSLSDDLWQKASEVLTRLEGDGLVKKAAASGIELGKPKAVLAGDIKISTLKLPGKSKPKAFGLTKVVYSDRRGERLARKKHKGWKPVAY